MHTLLQASAAVIRKHWPTFQDAIQLDSLEYRLILEAWRAKFELESTTLLDRLERFARHDVAERELIFEDLAVEARRECHELCDQLGLHHESQTIRRRKRSARVLHVTKPQAWAWEFSAPNPSNRDYEARRQRSGRRLRNKSCSECGRSGLEVELLCNAFVRDLFCVDCVEADDELNAHKWESIEGLF